MTFNILKREVTAASPDGCLITMDMLDSEQSQKDTVMCCHCGRHWVLGKALEEALKGRLGYCAKCDGVHCPRESCKECVPLEKRLEIMEGSRDPTAVSVSRGGIVLPSGV